MLKERRGMLDNINQLIENSVTSSKGRWVVDIKGEYPFYISETDFRKSYRTTLISLLLIRGMEIEQCRREVKSE